MASSDSLNIIAFLFTLVLSGVFVLQLLAGRGKGKPTQRGHLYLIFPSLTFVSLFFIFEGKTQHAGATILGLCFGLLLHYPYAVRPNRRPPPKPRKGWKEGDELFRKKVINGVVHPPNFSETRLEYFKKDFITRDDDIFVISYPKTGTTWVSQILHLLNRNGDQGHAPLPRAVPWVEHVYQTQGPDGWEALRDKPGRRVLKSHLHSGPLGETGALSNPRARFVVCTRNPKDTAVSLYYHMKDKPGWDYRGDWDQFFELYLRGEVEGGSFFDHTLAWHALHRRRPQQVAFVHYEDLHRDFDGEVRRLAAFCGLPLTEQLLARVRAGAAFTAMRADPLTNFSNICSDHIRRGEVGDWRNHFSIEQNLRMNRVIEEKLAGSDLHYFYGASRMDRRPAGAGQQKISPSSSPRAASGIKKQHQNKAKESPRKNGKRTAVPPVAVIPEGEQTMAPLGELLVANYRPGEKSRDSDAFDVMVRDGSDVGLPI